jgi:hypothetical protein
LDSALDASQLDGGAGGDPWAGSFKPLFELEYLYTGCFEVYQSPNEPLLSGSKRRFGALYVPLIVTAIHNPNINNLSFIFFNVLL